MKRRAALSAASVFCAFFLCSCASLFGPETFQLTEKDSGGTITAEKNDTVTVSLESNPTTGYLWEQAAVPDPYVLRKVKDEFLAKPVDGTLCGVPGKQCFFYKVYGGGEASIKLVYRRSWEKDVQPAETFQIRVKVKGDPVDRDDYNGMTPPDNDLFR